MKEIIVETTCLDENMKIKTLTNLEQNFGYRESIFTKKNYIILSTKLKLEKADKNIIENKMKECNENRKSKQPLEYPSAGSVFKRGNDFIAAELIDKSGLKGYNIGNAFVSEKHAGFIINKGGATADEVLQLIEKIKKVVYEKFNKNIETEIEFIEE